MLSRREFLNQSAAAAALLALPPVVRRWRRRPTCVVLDLGEHCGLRESAAGYLACLDDTSVILSEATKDLARGAGASTQCERLQIEPGARHSAPSSFASLGMTRIAIIPGASHIDSATARLILSCLQQGGTVLLESGATFGDHWEHREQLRNYFQILLEPPVDLWPTQGIPYVEYSWPIATKVRDFSRVLPLARQRGTMIAKVNEIPVALTRRVGSGILIFLGSPLGPALWAGDTEAKRWLHALLALGAHRQT